MCFLRLIGLRLQFLHTAVAKLIALQISHTAHPVTIFPCISSSVMYTNDPSKHCNYCIYVMYKQAIFCLMSPFNKIDKFRFELHLK